MPQPNRRTAIKSIGAASASLLFSAPTLAKSFQPSRSVQLGVIADLHGGLAVDAEVRLDSFLHAMNQSECDALIQLGDFAYPNEKHQRFADKLNDAHATTLHVIGNHEFDHGLTRKDCFQAWGIPASYYAKDVGDLRVLVLDGNERGSPTHRGGYPSFVGKSQQKWLTNELEASQKPVLILSHQPLAGPSAIDNCKQLQALLAEYRSKILICLNGHSHIDALILEKGVPYLHINSASYFWVGGEQRMAYYQDPLFTTVKIHPHSATVEVSACNSSWKEKSPREIGYFEKKNAPPERVVTPRIRNHHVSKTDLKIMTWNIWGRLNEDPRYNVDGQTARQRTIEIIQSSGVDIVAMIETYGSAAAIADELGFQYHTTAKDANLCIFSRYPLTNVELLQGLNPFSFIAATVSLPGGQTVRLYDIWLTSGGRHIVEIKDPAVSDETFQTGDDNRFDHVQQLLTHEVFQNDLAASNEVPLIVAGDFNCVPHTDYTETGRASGLNYSRVLQIKVSQAMAKAGFVDTYRKANPKLSDTTLGHTWTTVGPDYVYESEKGFVPTKSHPRPEYRDLFARIDYIYSRGEKLEILDSKVISRHPEYPDRKFPAFPSDHAAVVTHFRVHDQIRN